MSHLDIIRKALGDDYVVDVLAANANVFLVLPAISPSGGTAAPEQEDDQERARLTAMGIRALKAEAKERGFEPADLKGIEKDDLIEAILNDIQNPEVDSDEDGDDEADESEEEESDDDEESDDEEGEDEDGEEDEDAYTESALKAMSLAELKTALKEAGWEKNDLKGKSQEDLIAEYGEHIGFADEDGEDGEDEEEGLDEEALLAMSLAEVKQIAKDYGVKVTKGAKQKDIVAAILEQAGEESDDEDEEDGEDEPPF